MNKDREFEFSTDACKNIREMVERIGLSKCVKYFNLSPELIKKAIAIHMSSKEDQEKHKIDDSIKLSNQRLKRLNSSLVREELFNKMLHSGFDILISLSVKPSEYELAKFFMDRDIKTVKDLKDRCYTPMFIKEGVSGISDHRVRSIFTEITGSYSRFSSKAKKNANRDKQIYDSYISGSKAKAIANEFGLSTARIGAIVYREERKKRQSQ